MEKTETPRTDAAETKFLEGRSLTWMDVMAKSVAVFVEMRQLERELRDAQACIRDLTSTIASVPTKHPASVETRCPNCGRVGPHDCPAGSLR